MYRVRLMWNDLEEGENAIGLTTDIVATESMAETLLEGFRQAWDDQLVDGWVEEERESGAWVRVRKPAPKVEDEQEPYIEVWAERHNKREVRVRLMMSGFRAADWTVEGVRGFIVEHLRTEGLDGEGGDVLEVTVNETGISVITSECGFGIGDDDIIRALNRQGTAITC